MTVHVAFEFILGFLLPYEFLIVQHIKFLFSVTVGCKNVEGQKEDVLIVKG